MNRSVPISPEKEVILKPKEQKLIKVKAPFIDEISGMAIIKILDRGTYSTLLIKLKFMHNKTVLDIINKGKDTMIFKPGGFLGIMDLRSLGYYKIKQGILQQNLSRYYRFEKAEKLCEYFNKFVNTLKKEREQKSPRGNYPWLDPDDDRRHMTDREILEKFINLDNSFGVDFSYCWINLEVLKYSLEQNIGFVVRQAFIHYCGLHQVWREAEN